MHQLSGITGMFFCGVMAVLIFFVSILYFKNRERIYLFYALFLLFSLAYGFVNIRFSTWIGDLFGGYFQGNIRLIEPLTMMAFAAYVVFSVELVGIRHYSRRVANAFSAWAIACVVYAIAHYMLYEAIIDHIIPLFIVVRLIVFALSVYFLGWIILKTHSPVKKTFVLGTLAYFAGAIVASVRYSLPDLPISWLYRVSAPNYFEMGILVETLFFAVALGQRLVLITDERDLAQKKQIELISENRRIVTEMNKGLERKVKVREEVILRAQERLNNEEKMRLKAEYERELARSESLARSLQINPHFLYNCLNSILYLIQSDQNKKASEYLIVFSRFIRQVLETSRKPAIPFLEELDIIKKYLKLEQNRFGDDFCYHIHGGGDVVLHSVMVPPMLLYPVVENAVWHGLMNSPARHKEIVLCIQAEKDRLIVRVTDNGVGWKSGKRRPMPAGLSERMGISLTKERIKLYNHSFRNQIDFRITELNDGTRTGTEAIFTIMLSQE